ALCLDRDVLLHQFRVVFERCSNLLRNFYRCLFFLFCKGKRDSRGEVRVLPAIGKLDVLCACAFHQCIFDYCRGVKNHQYPVLYLRIAAIPPNAEKRIEPSSKSSEISSTFALELSA